MCSIATEWSNKLEQLNQWLPLALLALNTVFGVLLTKTMHIFIQQVTSAFQEEMEYYPYQFTGLLFCFAILFILFS